MLVKRVLAGDLPAFAVLVKRHERSIRGVCWSVLRDHHLARDAAQEGFVEAYRGLNGLKEGDAFGGWAAMIARRRALRMARRRRPEAALDEPVMENDPGTMELLDMVTGLPAQEREVVMLRFFDGYESGEIAAILGRPVGTVTKQLSRAYERLRVSLSEELRR